MVWIVVILQLSFVNHPCHMLVLSLPFCSLLYYLPIKIKSTFVLLISSFQHLESESFLNSCQLLFHSRFDDLRSWCKRLRLVLVASTPFNPVWLKHFTLPTNQVNMLIPILVYINKQLSQPSLPPW